MKITKEYFSKAVKILKEYKTGNKTENDLLQLINEFEEKFKIEMVTKKIDSYDYQCQNELEGIQFSASKDNINDYVLFSDARAIDAWYLDYSKPKVLLKTDAIKSKECKNYFNYKLNSLKLVILLVNLVPFYDRIGDLKKIGFEIGVAISNVSKEFSLAIQLGAKKEIYKTVEEISLVLNVLNICFKKATDIENNFWQAYSEIDGFNITLTNDTLRSLNSVINLVRNTKQIQFAVDSTKYLDLMKANDDRWRFFLPLDGIDSTLESIKMMTLIRDSQINISNIEFVVGKLAWNQYYSTPILLLIKNSKIHLVLSDYVDVIILINHCDGKLLKDIDFKTQFKGLLSIESLGSTFHQENADYTIEVFNKLSKDGKKKKILVESHPFKRLNINETSFNELLNRIRLLINSPHETNLLLDNLIDEVPQIIREDIRRLLAKRKYFSALDLLNKQYFNDNFNILKKEIEELYSEFDSIEKTLSGFRNIEIEFITKNNRFKYLFGNKLLNQLVNISKFLIKFIL